MSTAEQKAGRPRTFDEAQVLDLAVETFWRHGSTNTTTRILEAELGMSQSSIYNAFGSKRALLGRSLDRYQCRIEDAVVAPLDVPNAGLTELLQFVDDLVQWVTVSDRPGCLLLNLLAEQGHRDDELVERAHSYRNRLRAVMGAALDTISDAEAEVRTELLLAAVMGTNIAARGGAAASEISALADSLRVQLREWDKS